ncbi:hypothetical protein [Burkholderia gladioli]|uniref:hypothetical protein n=1 Tax=Burkholderia gladioli TaxID=28095 RepID=UPI00164017D2|nr:hypothetical protein [Burkholderia gladioli]
MKNNAPEWARPVQQSPLSYLWKNQLLNNKKIIRGGIRRFWNFDISVDAAFLAM